MFSYSSYFSSWLGHCLDNKVVYGAERPGQAKPNPDMHSTPRGPSVPSHVVDQWCAHMRSKGVKRVLCLLSDPELSFYSDPLLPQLAAHFETSAPPGGTLPKGERVLRIEPHAEDALVTTVACLKAAVAAQEPVVVFCSTGQARTGMVLSFWLHHAYALSVAAAVRNQKSEHPFSSSSSYCIKNLLSHAKWLRN